MSLEVLCAKCGKPVENGQAFVSPGYDKEGKLLILHAECSYGTLRPRTMTPARAWAIGVHREKK